MNKKNNSEEFEIDVYACDGDVSQSGYSTYNKGMVHFNYGNCSMSSRGNSKSLVRNVVSDLKCNLRKNSGIRLIRFNFPDCKTSVQKTADGYFGRPVIVVGAIFLKPLFNRRKIALSREINKIDNIRDKGGNLIKLMA